MEPEYDKEEDHYWAMEEWKREDARRRAEIEAKYPFHYTITHEGEGGETPYDEYQRMVDWLNGTSTLGQDWTATNDSIGWSTRFWIRDPELAMRFKLSFNFA